MAERQVQVYEVFARHGDQPAYHVGSVRAVGPEDAGVFAYTLYDEWNWRELFVVPRSSLVPVIRPE